MVSIVWYVIVTGICWHVLLLLVTYVFWDEMTDRAHRSIEERVLDDDFDEP
jgi:hypothetical protein